jgi:hypothetical protein
LVNQAKDIEGGAGIKIEAPGMEKKENAVCLFHFCIPPFLFDMPLL